MSIKPNSEVRDIISKLNHSSSMAVKNLHNLIDMKNYDNAKKAMKDDFYLNDIDSNKLLDYYKSINKFKRKLVEITQEELIERFNKAEENLKKAKLLKNDLAYEDALEDTYEQYIFFIGERLIQSGVCNNDGTISISGARLGEMFFDIKRVDQIFAIEWIEK